MKFSTISFWICTFLFAGLSNSAFSETEADSLKTLKRYREAALAYELEGYYSTSSQEKVNSLMKKAECLKELSLYDDAKKSLLRANFSDLNDSSIFNVRYQTALCAYLAADFETAESQLIQIQQLLADSNFAQQTYLLHSLILNEKQLWNEAKTKMLRFVNSSAYSQLEKDSLQKQINFMYSKKNIPQLKKLRKAQTMSALMPGTGHMYAGYFWEGMANLSFQLAALAFTGYNIYTKYYVTSVFIGYSIFQKFYMGGLNRVEFLVKKKNYELTRKFNEKTKFELLAPLMLDARK